MKKPLTARFGERVRELRRRKNLSLEALAGRCKLNSNFLQKLETGKQSPTLDSIEKLAAGMDIPVAQLFAFDEQAAETRKRLKVQIDKANERDVARIARLLDAVLY